MRAWIHGTEMLGLLFLANDDFFSQAAAVGQMPRARPTAEPGCHGRKEYA